MKEFELNLEWWNVADSITVKRDRSVRMSSARRKFTRLENFYTGENF